VNHIVIVVDVLEQHLLINECWHQSTGCVHLKKPSSQLIRMSI
jgi:hypothetical protein